MKPRNTNDKCYNSCFWREEQCAMWRFLQEKTRTWPSPTAHSGRICFANKGMMRYFKVEGFKTQTVKVLKWIKNMKHVCSDRRWRCDQLIGSAHSFAGNCCVQQLKSRTSSTRNGQPLPNNHLVLQQRRDFAVQPDQWDLRSEISTHPSCKLQFKVFSVSLRTRNPISFLSVVTKAGSDSCELPLKATKEDEEVTASFNITAASKEISILQ